MDWEELRNREELDPMTPAEYTEIARRLVTLLIDNWDRLPDGDGINVSAGALMLTKTDFFHTLSGCCLCAIDRIQEFGEILEGIDIQ